MAPRTEGISNLADHDASAWILDTHTAVVGLPRRFPTFSDLDKAIDILKLLSEKYTLLVCAVERERLEPLHRSGLPTIYSILPRFEKHNPDLLEEMKRRKLREGWDSIFLDPWAAPETIALQLAELPPPKRNSSIE